MLSVGALPRFGPLCHHYHLSIQFGEEETILALFARADDLHGLTYVVIEKRSRTMAKPFNPALCPLPSSSESFNPAIAPDFLYSPSRS